MLISWFICSLLNVDENHPGAEEVFERGAFSF